MTRTKTFIKGMDIYRQVPKDCWGTPIIKRCMRVPHNLISFSDLKGMIPADDAIHFFLHDQIFERVWNQYHRYTKFLGKYRFLLTPDFSAYMDMPSDVINYNIWRARLLGSWWQLNGYDVIPTITWAGVNSYDKCFSGVEYGGVVAIGPCPKRNKKAANRWYAGFYEMVERLRPATILIYGCTCAPVLDVDTEILTFANPYIERMRRNQYGR